MQRLVVWRRLSDSRRWLLVEAYISLLAARWAIRVIPFRRLTWFFVRTAARPEATGAERARLIRRVRQAIYTVSRRQPELLVCFPRAAAAQAMLRRRGVSTTLYYGATSLGGRGLVAHVWLQDGDSGVIGRLAAERAGHRPLARFAVRPLPGPATTRPPGHG
jgi:hypothetical protein